MNQEYQEQFFSTVGGTWILRLIEISTWYGSERE